MVTLCRATWRARPATKPVRPARAPLDMPSSGIGDLTDPEVMLTMRPNLRSIMPSTTALISMMGVTMLPFTAFIQAVSSHSRKSPRGGPPALFTRMSGSGHAASTLARPSGVVMSAATAVTVRPVAERISAAVASSSLAVRELITKSTPFLASDIAQAFPSPLLAAHTIAFLSLMPRSMVVLAPCC